MYAIVPLAGPDFYDDAYGVKPLIEINGEPLIKAALHSRNWYKAGELKDDGIIFVLRDIERAVRVEEYLTDIFTGCRIVKVSDITKGALLSALAGAALIKEFDRPVVVDLVDIVYTSAFSPAKIFHENPEIGGILPYFKSTNSKYSYLEIKDGHAIRTAEKKVISDNASAGTYFFRDVSVLLEAAADSIKFTDEYSFKDILFVCPCFNGIVKTGKKVLAARVGNVNEISLKFHS